MPFALIRAIRPKQWIKNLIIAGPVIFSLNLFDVSKLLWVGIAIALFSAAASSVYLINDIADIEKDRLHPTKKNRPLASGALKVPVAIVAAVVLSLGSIGISFTINTPFAVVLTLYLVSNLAYSFVLKHVVILDAMFLALGFVFRVLAGAYIIAVPASEWIIMCTFLLALFLGFAKRRHELVLLSGSAETHRRVLEHYSPYFLDQMIMIVTAATVMSYALYTVNPHTVEQFGTSRLIYTIPFVLYGIFRYLYLVHQKESGGNPTKVFLTDKPLLINVVLWMAVCVLMIYSNRLLAVLGI